MATRCISPPDISSGKWSARPARPTPSSAASAWVRDRDRADHFPEEMSGGEMQRVAVARALVTESDAVLCDEPTGNLDSATSAEVLALLRSLPESGKRSVVMVTHDPQAAAYGDRLVKIRDGLVEATELLEPRADGVCQMAE